MNNQSILADNELKEFGYEPKLSHTLTTWQLTAFGLTYLQPIGPAVIFGFLLSASGGSAALPFMLAFVGMIVTLVSKYGSNPQLSISLLAVASALLIILLTQKEAS